DHSGCGDSDARPQAGGGPRGGECTVHHDVRRFHRPGGVLPHRPGRARVVTCTASSTSSVTTTRSRSAGDTSPSPAMWTFIHSSRPDQCAEPTSTIGKSVTLPVWTRVNASNSSSIVPNPPGSTMKPWAYLTNIVFRTKKYRKLIPRSTQSL